MSAPGAQCVRQNLLHCLGPLSHHHNQLKQLKAILSSGIFLVVGNESWVLQSRCAGKFILGCLPTPAGIFQKEPQCLHWHQQDHFRPPLAFSSRYVLSLHLEVKDMRGRFIEPTSLRVGTRPPLSLKIHPYVSWAYWSKYVSTRCQFPLIIKFKQKERFSFFLCFHWTISPTS